MNRWQRIAIRVLVVAQLMAVASLASAMPCGEMMHMANAAGERPCCPDGADSIRDCLATCTLAAVALPDTNVFARTSVSSMRVDAAPPSPLLSHSDPPLKPPPIC